MMKPLLSVISALFLALGTSSTAVATVIFADNFEATTGSLPTPPNNPQTGSWVPQSLYGRVINSVSPGAHGGSNYLRIDRPSFSEFIAVSTSTSGATALGTPIHAEFWMNVAPNSYASFGLNAGTGANNALYVPLVSANPAGQIVNYNAVAAADIPTGLTYTPNVWHKYELDLILGSPAVTLTQDDVSTVVLTAPFGLGASASINAVHGIAFMPGSGATSMYVDDILVESIPEPHSATLATIATVALATFGARKPRNR